MLDLRKRFTVALQDTVKEFKVNESVKGIYVYGSYVHGNLTANSDLDLLVVWEAEEAPVRLLAEHKAVRVDMMFVTPAMLEDVLTHNLDDAFKIAQVISMIRKADIVHDPDNLLKDWKRRCQEFSWSEKAISKLKDRALQSLNYASKEADKDDTVSAVHEIRHGLYDLGRVVIMRNNMFNIIRPSEILTEIRLLDPIIYQLFLRTFKLKGYSEDDLLSIMSELASWIKTAVEKYESVTADTSSGELLAESQRQYHAAMRCTINGDFELAVFEIRQAIDSLGSVLLALEGRPNVDPAILVDDLREYQREYYEMVLYQYGAFDFQPKAIKRALGEAQFIAQRV
jgi:predicted nucleotidyltransferase